MGRRHSKASTRATPVVLDASAVIGFARGNEPLRRYLRRALAEGATIYVPAVVVAETVRGEGPRDAPVNLLLKQIEAVLPIDEGIARRAGHLLGRARSRATIDALVVSCAIDLGGARVLTSDSEDLGALARWNPEIVVRALPS